MYIGSLPPPNKVQVSVINFSLQEQTFSWSPVAPDCPAIHYNILASNCGSCPTTTNHINVTCTGIPPKGSMCIFAIQTVVCGNITGNTGDPIVVSISSAKTVESRAECTMITSLLAAALTAIVVISTIAIVIISMRSKAKIRAALEQSNRAERTSTIHMDSMYEDVTGPSPSASAINTQVNVAYGHTHKQEH